MSNKTPKKQPNETVSAPKPSIQPARRPLAKLLIGALLVGFGLLAILNGLTGIFDDRDRLIAPGGTLSVETVRTPELRQLGLSGRESIDDDYGLLFVFDNESDNNCFWMRDMQFPIDMIWLDSDKKVVTVINDVSPQTFPKSFCPEQPAKYGLEIKANTSNNLGIQPGSELRF